MDGTGTSEVDPVDQQGEPPAPTTPPALPEAVTREHLDGEGRRFPYVLKAHPGATDLVVHFSAFFGDWGEAQAYRATFQGYFHRLRMLGDAPGHNWLFVCDSYGADANGTYYTGEAGDFFVERAMLAIIGAAQRELGVGRGELVMAGSSMGATGALKFGLLLGARGIVAISPHVDLDLCAALQGRERHVAFLLADADTQAVHNYPSTRQIRGLLCGHRGSLPRLFVQACRDDAGVFGEQVVPLCETWRALGGSVDLDARARGGHTSDYATRPLLMDVIDKMYSGEPFDVRAYQRHRLYRVPGRPSLLRRAYVGARTLGSHVKRRLIPGRARNA